MLDAEFEVFESGNSLDNGPLALEAFSFHGASDSSRSELAQTGTPDWASDFQRLHIVDTHAQPIPPSQFREHEPLQRGSQGEWYNEFSRQRQKTSVFSQDVHKQIPGISRGYISPTNTYGVFDQLYTPVPLETPQRQPDQVKKLSIDDDALERAFDAISKELNHSENYAQEQETEYGQELSFVDEISGKSVQSPELKGAPLTELIGSDKILDEVPQEGQEKQARNEADELARTAGELLDNVKHDQSQKFRESNFLSLMRQLRDREVQVEGDKIVDVSIPLSQS